MGPMSGNADPTGFRPPPRRRGYPEAGAAGLTWAWGIDHVTAASLADRRSTIRRHRERNMTDEAIRSDFEELYGAQRAGEVLVPWDIGGPQPVVQQLVAYGAVRGEVLDPGTGPGHHAIYHASQGYSATGIDFSAAAIERARRNAEHAGVRVDFQVADATKLDGLEN